MNTPQTDTARFVAEESALSAAPHVSDATPAQLGVFDRLARLPAQSILDERALAEAFAVTPRTIRRMVSRYELPPGVPFAGRTVWIASKVLAYLEEKLQRAADDAEKRANAAKRH